MRPFRLVPLAALLLLVPVRSPGATPNPASPTPGWEFRVAPPGESGEPFVLEGRVIGEGGAPMRDVRIYAYHADASGKYSRGENHPRLEGLGRTNALGVFGVFRCRWDAPYSRGAVASVRPDAFSRLGR